MQNLTRKMSGQYKCFKCHFSKIEKWHFFIFTKKIRHREIGNSGYYSTGI